MAATTTKTSAATAASKMSAEASAAATDAMKRGQEYMGEQISSAEKMMDAAMEVNAAVFKGNEAIFKQAYANYTSNVAAMFEGTKALNKAGTLSDFYSASMANMNKAAEVMTEQYKGMSKLMTAVSKDVTDASSAAYKKAFA